MSTSPPINFEIRNFNPVTGLSDLLLDTERDPNDPIPDLPNFSHTIVAPWSRHTVTLSPALSSSLNTLRGRAQFSADYLIQFPNERPFSGSFDVNASLNADGHASPITHRIESIAVNFFAIPTIPIAAMDIYYIPTPQSNAEAFTVRTFSQEMNLQDA